MLHPDDATYATGCTLNPDKSYRLLIKPVVEEKGLICIRADELRHSGTIDVPMYQELLTADIVIADLSTANPNALYELGIRRALRPRTTIVISENKLPYPFDLNHVTITSYTHLGEAIDFLPTLQRIGDGQQRSWACRGYIWQPPLDLGQSQRAHIEVPGSPLEDKGASHDL